MVSVMSVLYVPYCRGGVKFEDLDFEAAMLFQQRILATLLEIERTYVELAARDKRNVLIVCDRGSMDPFACEELKL